MDQTTEKNTLLVIGGATATGKTALAVRLAGLWNTEILSADSRQFYREMHIGTAKPTLEERGEIVHHFIDSRSIREEYSVGEFERDALRILGQIFETKRLAILTGGSGLFIQAVSTGLDEFPPISIETKRWVNTGEQAGGLAWLQQELAARDPGYFTQVDQQNPARLRRALEVCVESGRPYSDFRLKKATPRPFQVIHILLELPREVLYSRINARVEAMIEAGLEAEARTLLPYRKLPALRTVGYEEWFEYFDGKLSRTEAIEKIKQHSRNYAKRQATWFRKQGDWVAFHPDDRAGILAYCREKLGDF